jgi:hypothetical protein
MKKSPLKLTLNRETLRTLEQPQLETVAGGTGSDCYGSSCTPGCNTSPTGGSRYC